MSDQNQHDYQIGDIVETPYGEHEVWKVTPKSVHMRKLDKYNLVRGKYTYLVAHVKPMHHMQTSINQLRKKP